MRRKCSQCLQARLLCAAALLGFLVGRASVSRRPPVSSSDLLVRSLQAYHKDHVEARLESKIDALLRPDYRPPIIFGHLHVGKTGGTSLNANLSMQFERVCGNKGYSFSSFQANEQVASGAYGPKNSVVLVKENLFTRFDSKVMDEIGYEDCDYISVERDWKFWKQFNDFHGTQIELHVPCRDPIDHLMSGCNYIKKSIHCDTSEKNLFRQLDVCAETINPRRFSADLAGLANIHLKCFDFSKFTGPYMDYIAPKLQTKNITAPYVFRSTNGPRDKTKECIWKHPQLMNKVKMHVVKNYDYFKYCDECIGTASDITSENFVAPEYGT